MALPALIALARVADHLTIQAPRWGADLYRSVSAEIVPRGPMRSGDAAVLFAPSLRVAWQARRIPRRIGVPGDWRRWLLTDVVRPQVHRRDTYASLVAPLGAVASGRPVYARRSEDPIPDLPRGHVGLNPVSVSGETVQWAGYRQLADRLDVPVVFYGGPGEAERVAAVAGAHQQCVGLPLPNFAGALSRCSVFVSNDSGAAHFAAAVGVKTVVVYGSTAPDRTGPAGSVAVEGPSPSCRPCYAKRCHRGLECLEIPVERVEAVVRRELIP